MYATESGKKTKQPQRKSNVNVDEGYLRFIFIHVVFTLFFLEVQYKLSLSLDTICTDEILDKKLSNCGLY